MSSEAGRDSQSKPVPKPKLKKKIKNNTLGNLEHDDRILGETSSIWYSGTALGKPPSPSSLPVPTKLLLGLKERSDNKFIYSSEDDNTTQKKEDLELKSRHLMTILKGRNYEAQGPATVVSNEKNSRYQSSRHYGSPEKIKLKYDDDDDDDNNKSLAFQKSQDFSVRIVNRFLSCEEIEKDLVSYSTDSQCETHSDWGADGSEVDNMGNLSAQLCQMLKIPSRQTKQ